MNKMILSLVVILSTYLARSQVYIGWNEAEILSESSAIEEVIRDSLQDGTQLLTLRFMESNLYTRRYFFDHKTQRCNLYIVEPADQKALVTFTQFCDENYTPAGERRWKVVLNGFTVDITLEQGSITGRNYFYFERPKLPKHTLPTGSPIVPPRARLAIGPL